MWLFYILTLCLYWAPISVVQAQVIGLDIGSEFLKVALVSPGKRMEILLNANSQRKTANAISFAETEERRLGDAGAAQVSKKPARVFLHSHLFLGINPLNLLKATKEEFSANPVIESGSFKYKAIDIKDPSKFQWPTGFPWPYYPYPMYMDIERESLAFQVRDDVIFPAELLSANILSFMRQMAARNLQLPLKNSFSAVATVPCNFNQRQRTGLRDALEIAGFNIIKLVNSGTAAALQSAIDMSAEEISAMYASNSSQVKLFLDIGSTYVTSTVVKFDIAKKVIPNVTVLSCQTDMQGGGHHMDIYLGEKLRQKFETDKNLAPDALLLHKDTKHLKKLIKQANAAKKILSTNHKANVHIEGFFERQDFSTSLSRSELEDILEEKNVLKSIYHIIDSSLEEARLSISDINQVELLGGGWRVPKIQQSISEYMKDVNVGTHLNGDEAMATGAGFVAANHTATFRVKDIWLNDISPYEYTLQFLNIQDSDGEEKIKTLIPKNTRFPSQRTASIRTLQNFKIQLLENKTPITTFEILNIPEAITLRQQEIEKERNEKADSSIKDDEGEPKASIVFNVDPAGVIQIDRAFLTFDRTVYVPKYSSTTTTTTTTSSGEDTTTTTTTSSTSSSSVEMKKQIKQFHVPLKYNTVHEAPIPLNEKQKEELKSVLKNFERIDLDLHKLQEAMNVLESLIYSCKSLLSDEDFISVTDTSQHPTFKDQLEQDEDWVYFSAKTEGLTAIENKIKYYKGYFEPGKKRAAEKKIRPKVIQYMNDSIGKIENRVKSIETERSWLPEAEITKLKDIMESLKKWWNEASVKQEGLSSTDDPAYTEEDANMRIKNAEIQIEKVEAITTTTTTTTSSTSSSSSDDQTKSKDEL